MWSVRMFGAGRGAHHAELDVLSGGNLPQATGESGDRLRLQAVRTCGCVKRLKTR